MIHAKYYPIWCSSSREDFLRICLYTTTVNWDILVWVKFGAFAPKWGGIILVRLILALWLLDVSKSCAFVYDVIMLKCDTQSTHIWLH